MLTIAHRLDTIVDYDRVLVLSEGLVAEDDEPKALIAKDGGMFRAMWEAHQNGGEGGGGLRRRPSGNKLAAS